MKKLALRYSLEFIVIVFGISISFYLEKQNALSYKEDLKNESLSKLKDNINAEIDGLIFDIKVHSNASKYGDIIYDRGEDLYMKNKDSLGFYLSYVIYATTIYVDNNEEYSSLKNSGLIELIENRNLISLLQNKYSQHSYYNEVGNMFTELYFDNNSLRKYLDSKNRKKHWGLAAYSTSFKSDMKYINDTEINMISSKSILHKLYSNLLKKALKTDSLILKEISEEISINL